MLTELCQELKNWFEREIHVGTFTIEGGQLTDCSFLQDGQYYRIIGSVFNDGVQMTICTTSRLMERYGRWLSLLKSSPCRMR